MFLLVFSRTSSVSRKGLIELLCFVARLASIGVFLVVNFLGGADLVIVCRKERHGQELVQAGPHARSVCFLIVFLFLFFSYMCFSSVAAMIACWVYLFDN